MREIAVVGFIMFCLFMTVKEQKAVRETAPMQETETRHVVKRAVRETPTQPVVVERRIIVQKVIQIERPVIRPVKVEREVKEPVNYYAMGYSDEGSRIDQSNRVCQSYSACEQYERGQRDRRYGR